MINAESFFKNTRLSLFHGFLSEPQVDNINAILNRWDQAYPKADIRHIAYSLATTYHETDFTMLPIKEYGEGRGYAYGQIVGPWHQVYYGRGDVQETWERNYIFATRRLRELNLITASQDLDKNPDLALDPTIAAAILVVGMEEGWFTGVGLNTFFNSQRSDPVNARRVVNGTDCCNAIAGYYRTFFNALTSQN